MDSVVPLASAPVECCGRPSLAVRGDPFTASQLLLDAPVLTREATGGEAYDILVQMPEIPGVAILDDDEIVGMVDRISLLNRFSRHLMRDYYLRRPVGLVIDPSPLIVEAEVPIRVLAACLSHDKPQALTAGFIITREGRYAGVGTALDMMKASVEEAQHRAEELAQSRRAAEEASRAKTLFLANMSHEFRTPLNAIIGFGDLLAGQKFGPLNARQAEYIDDIRNSGVHLLALISDILDLSKAEAGKLELHEEWVSLRELVAACVRLVRGRVAEAGLELRWQPSEIQVDVLADAVKVKQILMNLLSNAVKFTPRGGDIAIAVDMDAEGGVAIGVADTGIGMSADQIPMALQAFTQIDNARNRSHQGTGLGLPLCKQLIELHGGTLAVASELGKGTTMRVRFPPSRVVAPATSVSAA